MYAYVRHYLFHSCFSFCKTSPNVALTSICVYRSFRDLPFWLTTSARCWCSWLFLHSSWNFGEVSPRGPHSHLFYSLIWRMSLCVSLQVASVLIDKESPYASDCYSFLFPKLYWSLLCHFCVSLKYFLVVEKGVIISIYFSCLVFSSLFCSKADLSLVLEEKLHSRGGYRGTVHLL